MSEIISRPLYGDRSRIVMLLIEELERGGCKLSDHEHFTSWWLSNIKDPSIHIKFPHFDNMIYYAKDIAKRYEHC
jgi:hypothetical protein